MCLLEATRCLSIQSSVVHGYVGNKCAVLALQLHGFDVDPINSVQLSNHTGYSHFQGQKLSGDELEKIVDGLRQNQLLRYEHLVTGYMGSISFLERVVLLITELRIVNPNLFYICDPVMGDDGRLYVPQEFLDVYRTKLVNMANLVTPNQTEAELLSGHTIRTVHDMIIAADIINAIGPAIVLISSFHLLSKLEHSLNIDYTPEREILVFLFDAIRNKRYLFIVPRYDGYFSGTGDLMASLLLAFLKRTFVPNEINVIERALFKTHVLIGKFSLAALQAVIRRTCNNVKPASSHCSSTNELALVASLSDLRDPLVFADNYSGIRSYRLNMVSVLSNSDCQDALTSKNEDYTVLSSTEVSLSDVDNGNR